MRIRALGTIAVLVCTVLFRTPTAASPMLTDTRLPDGLSRFNPAGLSPDWIYEGDVFKVLAAPPPSGTAAPVLRFRSPKDGYVLAGSANQAHWAENHGYTFERIAFYAPRHSRKPVFRFRDGRTGRLFYTTQKEGLDSLFKYNGIAFYAVDDNAGSRSSHSSTLQVARYRNKATGIYLFTSCSETPYMVGAYYFGSFSPSATNIINGTRRIYGRERDWWGGVKDFYGKEPGIAEDHRGWPGEWPHLKPVIGYYDQSLPTTLEQHITQAADAGLTFFSFYWYPLSRASASNRPPDALASFLQARNLSRLKFNLAFYSHPWDENMAIHPDDVEHVVDQLITYFRHPQYLRLPDGRPIFVVGDDRNIRSADDMKCDDAACNEDALRAFLIALKKRSIKLLGVAPFVQLQVGVPAWDHQREEDGITCQAPPTALTAGTPYPKFTAHDLDPVIHAGKPASLCMFQNFDERPRQDILVTDRQAIRFFVGKSDNMYRHNLTIAKDVADSHFKEMGHPSSRIVYLYAWNEWHEGGILEPNVQSGAKDLNVVTDVFQLPRSPSRCLDSGDCLLR